MSLQIASIASGSNGNCYYIGNDTEAVLVDVGIHCREIERRMQGLSLSINRIKAIFISHEHTDHIKGVSAFARKYDLPVYVTPGTAHGGRLNLDLRYMVPFDESAPVSVGRLSVSAFKKHHDAWDPHSFTISQDGITIGVFTDLGQVCSNLVQHFSRCHAAFLEANYDTGMLMNGYYPYHLKTRISGGKGHLSNDQALDLFRNHRPPFMSHLLLSHISKDNNDLQLVERLFKAHATHTTIAIASRFEPSPVYNITNKGEQPAIYEGVPQSRFTEQLSLFQ